MVLIRKEYFKERCELVIREHREKHRIRAVWNSIGRRAFRRTVPATPDLQLTGPEVEEEPTSPDEPIVAAGEGIAAALVGGTGVGLSVGLGHKPFQDGALDGHVVKNPLDEILPVGKHTRQGVAADAHSFTSSPRSVVVSVRPVSPTSGHGNSGVRWDEQSFGSRQAKVNRNYMRKRASTSSLRSVRIRTDNHTSPSVHDDDAEHRGFWPPKTERPRHGRVPRTDGTLPTACGYKRHCFHRPYVEQDRGALAKPRATPLPVVAPGRYQRAHHWTEFRILH